MNAAFGSLILIVFLVIIMNFVALFIRMKKHRSPYGRRGKQSVEEEVATVVRDREVRRRLDLEQERIAKYLEQRKRLWALYEEVRQRHSGVKVAAAAFAPDVNLTVANVD